MSVRDLIPFGRERSQLPSLFRDDERDPFLSLHREVNRLFDDVFRGFDGGLPGLSRFSANGGRWPSVEISDGEKEIRVTAEVPGMEENDIEVLLDDGVLTLKGEKRSEVGSAVLRALLRPLRTPRSARLRGRGGQGPCSLQKRRPDGHVAEDGEARSQAKRIAINGKN